MNETINLTLANELVAKYCLAYQEYCTGPFILCNEITTCTHGYWTKHSNPIPQISHNIFLIYKAENFLLYNNDNIINISVGIRQDWETNEQEQYYCVITGKNKLYHAYAKTLNYAKVLCFGKYILDRNKIND